MLPPSSRYGAVEGYQRFRDPCCLNLQGAVLWKDTKVSEVHAASELLKRWYSTTTLHPEDGGSTDL